MVEGLASFPVDRVVHLDKCIFKQMLINITIASPCHKQSRIHICTSGDVRHGVRGQHQHLSQAIGLRTPAVGFSKRGSNALSLLTNIHELELALLSRKNRQMQMNLLLGQGACLPIVDVPVHIVIGTPMALAMGMPVATIMGTKYTCHRHAHAIGHGHARGYYHGHKKYMS